MRETFHVMCQAATDAKLTKVHAMSMRKIEVIIEFPNQLVQLLDGLEASGSLVP